MVPVAVGMTVITASFVSPLPAAGGLPEARGRSVSSLVHWRTSPHL